MSAYILAKAGSAFHLFTDGGIFDNNGRLVKIGQKVHILAHMPAIFTAIGFRGWGTALYSDLCSYRTLDQFLETAESRLVEFLPVVQQMAAAEQASTDFELVICGYSEQRRDVVCFMIGNHKKGDADEPWKLTEVTYDLLMNPPVSDEALAPLRSAGEFVPGRDGALLMQAQRAVQLPAFSVGAPGCAVGGHVQHTTITRDEVGSRIILRWPDELGKRIEP